MQTSFDAEALDRVIARIKSQAKIFNAARISHALLLDLICRPHAHWRKRAIGDAAKPRICYEPSAQLRRVHEMFARYISHHAREPNGQECYLSTAFGSNDSIVHNAMRHYGNRSSLVLDLQNAFASIKTKHVYGCLCRYFPDDLAWIMSRVLTYRGSLRQGSPASPRVYNLLMRRFDRAMAQKLFTPMLPKTCIRQSADGRWTLDCRPRGELVYTRYGDDLCFSSPEETFLPEFEGMIREVVAEHGFSLNHKRHTGANGILVFPGVVMMNGSLRPNNSIVTKFADAVRQDGWDSARVKGYQSFLGQFPRSGRKFAYTMIKNNLCT